MIEKLILNYREFVVQLLKAKKNPETPHAPTPYIF